MRTATYRMGFNTGKKRSKNMNTHTHNGGEHRTAALSMHSYRLTPPPKTNMVVVAIIGRLRGRNFRKSSLAKFGSDARSVAGDREGSRVDGMWHDRAVPGNRVAPGSRRC